MGTRAKSKKKAKRLAGGYPLSTGKTPKKPPKTTVLPTPPSKEKREALKRKGRSIDRLRRLEHGYPLADKRTTKEPPKTSRDTSGMRKRKPKKRYVHKSK